MLSSFRELRQKRHQQVIAWKERSGRKAIGLFCCDVPEELIYAAGLLPVRLLGEPEEATQASLHLPTNVCPYPRSCFDQALKGKYDYLDGLVVPNVCDIVRAMYGFWQTNFKLPFLYFLEVPQKISEEAITYFAQELATFQRALADFSGVAVTPEALREAIALYNESRSLLRQVSDLRKPDPPLVSGVEAQELVLAALFLPRDEYNQRLRRWLEEAERRVSVSLSGVRVLVSSSMLDDTDFLDLVEECDARVVADDMPLGSRYFYYSVDPQQEPLRALAERYLAGIPCPRKMLPEKRFDYVQEMMSGARVQGVVLHVLKGCDCHLYEYPYLRQRLEALGLPLLFFRGEEVTTEREQQRADLEAFVEMLEG